MNSGRNVQQPLMESLALPGEALTVAADLAKRLVFKWLNRRSQKASFTWERFQSYLEHYPLPEPRIRHRLYTLSTVS
jgi:hypothetical protein